MCGRFLQTTDADVLAAIYQITLPFTLSVRYNAAPTQQLAVLRRVDADAPREVAHLRWGLVPGWARPPKLPTLINARSETAAEKASFRRALRQRRCLVFADGFYEWLREGRSRRPFVARRRDRAPVVFAGIWERWTRGEEPIESFAILTATANDTLSAVHGRMPVVIPPEQQALWLDPTLTEVEAIAPLLVPSPAEDWELTEVVPLVNNVRNQGPGLLEEVRPGA